MALKDLVSDLSAFKGQTTPTSIDNQIEKGVDFFDNETAGADGFTPKTNLETKYNKFIKKSNSLPNQYNAESNFASPNSGVRPNTKTRNAYGQSGEYNEEGTPGLSNPPHILDSDTILSPVNQPQFTSAFMTTPIADYMSNFYPTYPSPLTFDVEQHTSTGPTQFTIGDFDNTPQFETAHGVNLLPTPNGFVFGASAFRARNRQAEVAPFHSSVSAPFTNEPLPSPFMTNNYTVIFGQNAVGLNLRDRYKDGSIHILSDDTKSPLGGNVTEFASLIGLTDRTSQFSTPETIGGDNVYTVPTGFTSVQRTLNLEREIFRRTEDLTTDTFQSAFSPITTKQRYEDSDYIDDLFEFKSGDYQNVPSGLDENNNFGTKKFKEVADPFNFDLFRQPFILRKTGNQWGFDSTPAENPLGAFLGGFVRGAPGITGLVDRSITDKFRIGKFLLTSRGIGFIGKQFILQGLNPTLESKIWNPLSTFSIVGASDSYEAITDAAKGLAQGQNLSQLASGLAQLAATVALPIGHPERHIGGGRYDTLVDPTRTRLPDFIKDFLPSEVSSLADTIPFGTAKFGYNSRLAMQSNPTIIPETTVGAFGFEVTIGGKDLETALLFMNPNKYLFPISSAPKSVGTSGVSFVGGLDLVQQDAFRATGYNKIGSHYGGTFNDDRSVNNDDNGIKRHGSLTYSQLLSENEYERSLLNPSDLNINLTRGDQYNTGAAVDRDKLDRVKVDNIGKQGRVANYAKYSTLLSSDIKGNAQSDNVDKVNMLPYGTKDEKIGGEKIDDFIKFKFHDMINDKFIIFRAILSGISDAISTDYGEEKYIGRPDKVYVYQGADRNVSFNFNVYPKTALELPVLMDKLNYLVGMCYPSFTADERMITPLMSLTLGDMFVGATGLLRSLTVTVEDASTWEITDGLQFPHFISCACEFTYIGNNVLTAKGKHYGLSWTPDGSTAPQAAADGAPAVNRFTNTSDLGFNDFPNRKPKTDGARDYTPIFNQLGQTQETTNEI